MWVSDCPVAQAKAGVRNSNHLGFLVNGSSEGEYGDCAERYSSACDAENAKKCPICQEAIYRSHESKLTPFCSLPVQARE